MEREEKKKIIRKEILEQLSILVSGHIQEICESAEEFTSIKESFSVSLKIKVKLRAQDTKIKTAIIIPGLKSKDETREKKIDFLQPPLFTGKGEKNNV